jgi:hypothetical protein
MLTLDGGTQRILHAQGGYRSGNISAEIMPGMRPALVSRIAPGRGDPDSDDENDGAEDTVSRHTVDTSELGLGRRTTEKVCQLHAIPNLVFYTYGRIAAVGHWHTNR